MKPILFFSLFLLSSVFSSAQIHVQADSITPPDDYNNIYVHKIGGDSLSTTFVIFVKEKVQMHKHEKHSETVIVLNGTGRMILGVESIDIKKGDILFIPKNTWHQITVTSDIPLKVVSIQAPHFDGADRIFYKKN